MFTTGSRFFFGLSVLGVIGAFAYGFNSEWEPYGFVVLLSVALVAFFLGCMMVAYRDASVPVSVGASSAADAEGEYGTEQTGIAERMAARRRVRSVAHGDRLRHRALRVPRRDLPARRGDDRVDGAGVVRPGVGRPRVQPVAPRPGPATRSSTRCTPSSVAPSIVLGFSRVLLSISKDAAVIVFIIFGAALLLGAIFSSMSRERAGGFGAVLLLVLGVVVIISAASRSASESATSTPPPRRRRRRGPTR